MIDCLLNGMINQAYIIFAGGASGLLAKYGIAGLESGDVSDKEALTSGPVPVQGFPETERNLGALRSPKTEEGGISAALGVRALMNPVLSGSAGSVGIRIGLAGLKDEDSEFLPSHRRRRTHEPSSTDREKKQGAGMKTRVSNYVGPRTLQNPGKNPTELVSRRLTKQEQTDPTGDQKNAPAQKARDRDAYKETGWVRRL